MNAGLGWTLAIGFVAAACARADDLPTKLSFDRYKTMLEHSPFSVATAIVAQAATPNFAQDLYVANAAKSREGDMVTIASARDKDFKKYLTTRAPVDGYTIANIEWSDKVGQTKVTISKDGQLATLGFNQMVVIQPVPNHPPGITSPSPSQQSAVRQPGSLPTPDSNLRGVIHRNP
jgi:hypothetical protein